MLDAPVKSLADVNAEWLTAALRQEGHLGDADKVDAVTVEPMNAGVGLMSAMAKLHLQSSADLPDTLVIKLPSVNVQNRGVAEQFLLYMKEARYYIDLSTRTSAKSPTIYASYINDDQDFLLLMEDVSDYRLGNQVTGATLAETEVCIDELAKLHAAFWGGLEDVAWLPHMSRSDNATNMQLGAEAGWAQTLDFFGEHVPGSIRARWDEYLGKIAGLQDKLDGDPITLIHGDFRMDNMLFGDAPSHHPLVIVDFQGPLKGRGAADLGYLMSHSVQTEVRRQYEQELVKRYAEGLRAGGVTGYSDNDAWQDYRTAVLYSWTVAVVIAGTLDPNNERGFAWMSKMVKRNGIAIEDLDCLSILDTL